MYPREDLAVVRNLNLKPHRDLSDTFDRVRSRNIVLYVAKGCRKVLLLPQKCFCNSKTIVLLPQKTKILH